MNLENKNEEQIVAELLESIFGFKPEVKKAEYKTSEQINKDLKEAQDRLAKNVTGWGKQDYNNLAQQLRPTDNIERRVSGDNLKAGMTQAKASTMYKITFRDRNDSPITISEEFHKKLGEAMAKASVTSFRDELLFIEHEGEYFTIRPSSVLHIKKV